MFLKYKAKSEIKKLIAKGRNVAKNLKDSPIKYELSTIHGWKSYCYLTMKKWFGEEHRLTSLISNARLGPSNTVINFNNDEIKESIEDRESFAISIKQIIEILEQSLLDIEEYGLSRMPRHPEEVMSVG